MSFDPEVPTIIPAAIANPFDSDAGNVTGTTPDTNDVRLPGEESFTPEDVPVMSDHEYIMLTMRRMNIIADKVEALLESVTPEQVEKVRTIQSNPIFRNLLKGIIPG